MKVMNFILTLAIFIMTILSLEGAQWYFMPNFGCNISGIEKLGDVNEPYYTVLHSRAQVFA